jgi:hypothetical protein
MFVVVSRSIFFGLFEVADTANTDMIGNGEHTYEGGM